MWVFLGFGILFLLVSIALGIYFARHSPELVSNEHILLAIANKLGALDDSHCEEIGKINAKIKDDLDRISKRGKYERTS